MSVSTERQLNEQAKNVSYPFPSPDQIKNSISELSGRLGIFNNRLDGHQESLAAIKRLIRMATVSLRDWPVPISEVDAQALRRTVMEAASTVQRFGNSSDKATAGPALADELLMYCEQFEDQKMRAFANAQLSRKDEINAALDNLLKTKDDLLVEIGNVKVVSKNTATKQTIKNEQAFFATQATKFVWVGAFSLIAFVALSVFLLKLIGTFQSADDIIKGYAEDSKVVATMNSLRPSCPDCMHSFFLNTLFKANAVRILHFSFLFFLIAVALKSLNSAIHNYTINMHRSNALHAALRLFDKPETKEGKDALIDKAAAAIFSHQATGFNGKAPSNLLQSALEFGKKTEET